MSQENETIPLLNEDGFVIGLGYQTEIGVVVKGMFNSNFVREFHNTLNRDTREYTLDEIIVELDKLP